MIKQVVYSNDDKYIGGFLNNFRHGYGEYTFNNGDKLNCDWEHNRVNGNIIYTSVDGTVYKCRWFKGDAVGNAKIYNNNKQEIDKIEIKLKKIHEINLSFSHIKNKKIESYEKSNQTNLKLFFKNKKNYERYYIGNYLWKLFYFIFANDNKLISILFFPLTAFFVFTFPVFVTLWLYPFMLFFAIGGIIRAFTGQYFFPPSKLDNDKKSLFNDNLWVILIFTWTLFIGYIFYGTIFLNLYEEFFLS